MGGSAEAGKLAGKTNNTVNATQVSPRIEGVRFEGLM
jgi:hypothetical protein